VALGRVALLQTNLGGLGVSVGSGLLDNEKAALDYQAALVVEYDVFDKMENQFGLQR
jgi:hypothetical protein